MRWVWTAAILVAGVLLLGCAGGTLPSSMASAEATAPASAPSTSAAARAGAGAARVILPSGWQNVDLRRAALREEAARVRSLGPRWDFRAAFMERIADDGSELLPNLTLMAHRIEGGDLIGVMSALEFPAGPSSSLELLEQRSREVWGTFSGRSEQTVARLDLPAGEALLMAGDYSVTFSDGVTVLVASRDYYIVRDGVEATISFVCYSRIDSCVRDAEATMESLAFEHEARARWAHPGRLG